MVYPGALTARRESKREKLLQYAERVWNITTGPPEARIDAAIARTRAFFEAMGVRTRLADYGVGPEAVQAVARRFASRNWNTLGERQDIGPRQVEEILAHCV